MEEFTTDWSILEFKAYLLCYAANSDFFETEEEKELIRKAVSGDTYKQIHREFESDNDYQSIQKILYNLEKFNYNKNETEKLIQDIQKMFLSDGKMDLLETNFMHGLKKLIA